MAVWGVTPDYITNNWTHELFDLMIIKLHERVKRESPRPKSDAIEVPANVMFEDLGIKVRKG